MVPDWQSFVTSATLRTSFSTGAGGSPQRCTVCDAGINIGSTCRSLPTIAARKYTSRICLNLVAQTNITRDYATFRFRAPKGDDEEVLISAARGLISARADASARRIAVATRDTIRTSTVTGSY